MDEELLTEKEKKRIEKLRQEEKDNQEVIEKMNIRARDWNSSCRVMMDRNREIDDAIRKIEYGYGIMWCIDNGMSQVTTTSGFIEQFKKDWEEVKASKLELRKFITESEWKITNAKRSISAIQMLFRNMKRLQSLKERPDRSHNYLRNKYY